MWHLLKIVLGSCRNSTHTIGIHSLSLLSRSMGTKGIMQYLQPLIICGPSGCGKSTLMKKLMEDYPEKFGFSVSHTTRKPRPGEEHGREYFFTERETMLQSIKSGEFIESAEYGSNMYGTSKKAVQDVLDAGKVCILDIDTQGVKNLKEIDMKCFFLFIKPPSMEVLEQRLRGRGTETEEAIQKRLNVAEKEMNYGAEPGIFDETVVNDDLEKAYSEFKHAINKNIISLT